MDPIDVRADAAFCDALKCVQFRIPPSKGYRPQGYLFALGARYGFIGMAASHHLFVTAGEGEEAGVVGMMEAWPALVREHVSTEAAQRLPFHVSAQTAQLVSDIAGLPLRAYLPLYHRLCPLSRALDLVGEALVMENRSMICHGWSWLRRNAAVRLFKQTLGESASYALHFFERRLAGCAEVPEIALIGE